MKLLRPELEKTGNELKRVTGDLGVTSGLVATNGKKLSALNALGARNYVEFNLKKPKEFTRERDQERSDRRLLDHAETAERPQ